jgi:transposase, IS5 family
VRTWCGSSSAAWSTTRPSCRVTQRKSGVSAAGDASVEQLLKTTIETAVAIGAVTKPAFERVIVDSTVQEKAIAHPTDSRLLEVARDKIARLAKRAGIRLKLTHEREGKTLRRRAAGYAHAKQFKRLKRVLRRQRTILGSLLREVRRKMGALAEDARISLDRPAVHMPGPSACSTTHAPTTSAWAGVGSTRWSSSRAGAAR